MHAVLESRVWTRRLSAGGPASAGRLGSAGRLRARDLLGTAGAGVVRDTSALRPVSPIHVLVPPGPFTWHRDQIAPIACIIPPTAGSYVVTVTWRQPVGSAGGDDIRSGAAGGLMAGSARRSPVAVPWHQMRRIGTRLSWDLADQAMCSLTNFLLSLDPPVK